MSMKQFVLDGTATLAISGRFTFDVHREFRDSYETLMKSAGVRNLDINLAEVEYIDSAALGMLLLLREKALAANVKIRLVHCKDSVKDVLQIANFNKLFTMN